jgi:hypothetical protein
VRDGADSIEVIVIQKKNKELRLLPWVGFGRAIPRDEAPGEELARTVAGCRLRLPTVFSAPWQVGKAIDELESRCREEGLKLWQRSPWLKGELFLILDEELETQVAGFRLSYSRESGLGCEKVEA